MFFAWFRLQRLFRFWPNDPRYEEFDAERKAKGIKGIAFDVLNFVKNREFNVVVKPTEKLRLLKDHNWPPAPGYFPFTLLQVHNDPQVITKPEFVQIVTQSYDSTFWSNRIEFWKSTNLFPNRIQYLERAVKAHFDKDYISSIHILLPQFEGIIRDYLSLNSITVLADKFQARVKALKDLFLSRKVLMVSRNLLDTFFEFLDDGTFWDHTSKIKDASVEINRHGVLHGVFTGFETEVISLKYLTLLDGLSFLLLYDKAITRKI